MRNVIRQATGATLPNATAMERYLCASAALPRENDASYARIAREAAKAIVVAGYGIVYGGARIGLMGILADTARSLVGGKADRRDSARSARTQRDRALRDHAAARRREHARAQSVNRPNLGSASIALPGGYGTMDEFCEIFTWRQLGFHDKLDRSIAQPRRLLRRSDRPVRRNDRQRFRFTREPQAVCRGGYDRGTTRADRPPLAGCYL